MPSHEAYFDTRVIAGHRPLDPSEPDYVDCLRYVSNAIALQHLTPADSNTAGAPGRYYGGLYQVDSALRGYVHLQHARGVGLAEVTIEEVGGYVRYTASDAEGPHTTYQLLWRTVHDGGLYLSVIELPDDLEVWVRQEKGARS